MKKNSGAVKVGVRYIHIYKCAKCNTKYEHKNREKAKKIARKCADLPTEERIFEVGDEINGIKHICPGRNKNNHWILRGEIVKIRLIPPPDEDWSIRNTGKHYREHVWEYETKFWCDNCQRHCYRTFLKDQILQLRQHNAKLISERMA